MTGQNKIVKEFNPKILNFKFIAVQIIQLAVLCGREPVFFFFDKVALKATVNES